VVPEHFSVKAPVFPFNKFHGIDTLLGPEMQSTGEVMGIDRNFGAAFAKAQLGAGNAMPTQGAVFISVRDSMELEVEDDAGDGCIYDDSFEITSDDGAYVVEGGELSSTGGDDPETCDITLKLTRSRRGSFENVLDPESRFRLHQVRSTSLSSAP
jgi:hypothetical protein